MKTIFKGMVLLLAGASFVACSKDVSFDENAQKQAEQEAQIAQKYATYQSDFVKAFGSIASGHQWGFDQTTGRSTRAAKTSDNKLWIIPANFGGGNQNAEGWNAKDLEGFSTSNSTLDGFNFNNYFLQHVMQPDAGKFKNGSQLEAWSSNPDDKGWKPVTNFSKGKNSNGSFSLEEIDVERTYFYGNIFRSAARTTLMADMGGSACDEAGDGYGKLFRVNNGDGTYNYNYGFITPSAYHKENGEWLLKESFLVIQFPPKNKNADPSHWIIRIGEAKLSSEDIKAEGRVLCEDMGANDFDFNDVVFDAWIMGSGDIKIKVLAHGGTLPIAIDGQEVTLGQMTNTGVNTDNNLQDITIPAVSVGNPKYKSIAAIPVTVNPNGEAGTSYNLEANVGTAPQKICAPINTLWPKEYTKISLAYSPFDTWVNMSDPAEWTNKMDPEKVFTFE